MVYDHTPGLRDWVALIERHYGSIDDFADRPTLYIMHGKTRDMIAANTAFLNEVEGRGLDTTKWEDDLKFLTDLDVKLTRRLT